VIVLGAVAIIGILSLQVYWFQKNYSIAEKEFQQSVQIALRNVAKDMAQYNGSILPSTNLIKQISSNYYVVNFNDIIDANVLEYYLLEEFEKVNLNTNFEYAIYDCSSDEMVYGNYCNVLDAERAAPSDNALPKYDDFIYYFGVKFPSRPVFLLSDLRISLFFSVITIFALVFFIYAIFIMLRQKRLSELQRDFINNMTHEFKTPISSIKIANGVFLQNEEVRSDKRLSQYARIIQQQNERLNQHVEKVLNIAKLDNQDFEFKMETIHLHDIVTEVLRSKALELQNPNVNLELCLDAENDLIEADPMHLSNILFNLIDNAIKYSNDAPEILVKTKNRGKAIEITVEDKGIGIASEHQKKLFKKFYRVPTGNVHNVKGFGLGLYYVKRIVDRHGWSIDLDSAPGKGTRIRIAMSLSRKKNITV
jgi:two-component system phosphate regulon sensor histidine kinase PhoR